MRDSYLDHNLILISVQQEILIHFHGMVIENSYGFEETVGAAVKGIQGIKVVIIKRFITIALRNDF